jgi:hypothetical protein
MTSKELDPEVVERLPPGKELAVAVENGTFFWGAVENGTFFWGEDIFNI